jgi:hypothetical protein
MQLTYPTIYAITKHRNTLKALGVKLKFNFIIAIFALLAYNMYTKMNRADSDYINTGIVVFLLLLFLCKGYRLLRNFNIIDFLGVEISRNDGVFGVNRHLC